MLSQRYGENTTLPSCRLGDIIVGYTEWKTACQEMRQGGVVKQRKYDTGRVEGLKGLSLPVSYGQKEEFIAEEHGSSQKPRQVFSTVK